MSALSVTSARRFRTLTSRLATEVSSADLPLKVGLANWSCPAQIHTLDLDSRELRDEEDRYDLIILDSDAARRINAESYAAIAQMLQPRGAIAVRQRTGWRLAWNRWLRRRQEDVSGKPFFAGLSRSEAALLEARLHVVRLKVGNPLKAEQWVVGSRVSLLDNRFRDQIGRVATNYLR